MCNCVQNKIIKCNTPDLSVEIIKDEIVIIDSFSELEEHIKIKFCPFCGEQIDGMDLLNDYKFDPASDCGC